MAIANASLQRKRAPTGIALGRARTVSCRRWWQEVLMDCRASKRDLGRLLMGRHPGVIGLPTWLTRCSSVAVAVLSLQAQTSQGLPNLRGFAPSGYPDFQFKVCDSSGTEVSSVRWGDSVSV